MARWPAGSTTSNDLIFSSCAFCFSTCLISSGVDTVVRDSMAIVSGDGMSIVLMALVMRAPEFSAVADFFLSYFLTPAAQ